jgi:hypothetical protein
LRHHRSTTAQVLPQAWGGVPGHSTGSSADATLLQFADIAHDTRVVLIGPDTLELLCALIRLDCASAAAIRLLDRPKAGTADLAILPAVASLDCVDAGLAKARRVLAPLGSVILRFAGLPSPGLVRHTRQVLQTHGFQAIHARQLGHQRLLTAELPLVGRLACA